MSIRTQLTFSALVLSAAAMAAPAQATDRYIAEIFMTGANFCPRGTAETNGQLLAINQNQALFSLLGTNYGGDGRTSFGLPDLRGRSPVHAGNGPGLNPISLGSKGGAETNGGDASVTGILAVAGEAKGKKQTSTAGVHVRSPYAAVKFCIVTQGIFPSRN